jgi:cytochrome oxidase Cu insertion factor (SCO1/SenC/PrrC family)
LKDKPFALVGVNCGDELDVIKKATKEKDLIWRSFFAGDSDEIYSDYEIAGFPTIFILDADGVIQSVGHGTDDKTIMALLEKMEGGKPTP